MLKRTRRIVASLAPALLVLAGLTSCTPEIKGVTGLTVDADGQPLAALAWCANRPPDIVLLFAEEDSVSPAPSDVPTLSTNWPYWPGREYAVPRDATSPTTVYLMGFPPEPATDPHATFRLLGTASNNSFTSRSVTFRLADLPDLQPGSVLISNIVDNDEVQKHVSLDEFARLGRDEC